MSTNGWKMELTKYGGAVAIIVALTYFLNAVFAQRSEVDNRVLDLWEKQTKTLTEIRSILQETKEVQDEMVMKLDSLLTNRMRK